MSFMTNAILAVYAERDAALHDNIRLSREIGEADALLSAAAEALRPFACLIGDDGERVRKVLAAIEGRKG